ncbi:MAG TPA: beta-L-arabinofuranosidase domain-containing protein [Verrucomicrobiae bacterium]
MTLICAASLLTLGLSPVLAGTDLVTHPDTNSTNSFYLGNRAPLLPAQFVELPIGSIEPHGWLRAMLQRQREGLTGHLGEISAWLQKEDNAWLSKDGKGKYGWEELPYWLKGYIELAYIFNDPKMIAESQIWIEGALASQRPNGDFGPDQRFDDDGSRDFWANMIMLFCLQSYYDHTHDQRVLDLMTRYFKYHLALPDNQLLTHYWQKMRGGDEIQAIYWLYNRTGDAELLKAAEKVHRCTANWSMPNDLPNWHNVNIAEGFREPGEMYLQTHDPADLHAAYANFTEVRKRFGQVPGGMYGGDETCRAGYSDPRQAIETCGIVEQMLSDEMLLQISGDPFWADHCEEVAFNTYPAATTPEFTALRYLTAPNLAVSDALNHAPGVEDAGPFLMMNPFSSRCCQHNHSHGWPYFNRHLWLATPDNGLCAALYAANAVTAKVGDGTPVHIEEETHYPFEESIQFKLGLAKNVTFPLYLRLPAWCADPQITLNGKSVTWTAGAGHFVRLQREWKNGDVVKLTLPMTLSVQQWTANHDSVSVNYGPLTFSLKIGERFDRHDSTKTAIGDSSWQKGADPSKWPAWEIHPTTPWNYGLILDPAKPERSFTLKRGSWPANDYPFTPDSAPLTLEVKARQIPEWTLDRYGLCAVLQDSPVYAATKTETVSLVPMGAARLRIAAFPVIGFTPAANHWKAPIVPHPTDSRPSASHCFSGDTVAALNDGLEPTSSSDETIPRFTWWEHKGSQEWVQYNLPASRSVSSMQVYWFDDNGHGECRIPQSYRLLYLDRAEWKPVVVKTADAPAKDRWNTVTFDAVQTTALRLEVTLPPKYSSGILEWTLNSAK